MTKQLNFKENPMKKTLFFTLILSAFVLAACSGGAAPAQSGQVTGKEVSIAGGVYTDVSVAELETMLENKDFTLINVHIPFTGDIPDTDLSIPFDEIESNLNQLPADKDAKIVVYCRSDSMSSMSATALVELGYTDVWNLDGGMVAWQAAGNPLEGVQ